MSRYAFATGGRKFSYGSFPADLTGLTMSLCGDSITYANEIPYNYEDYLQANLSDITYTNLGVSGETMVASSQLGKAGMLSFVQTGISADIISVFAGTNDYGHSIALGTVNDTGTATVMGAVNSIINYVEANNPDAILFFIIPMTRQIGSDGNTHDYLYPNNLGLTIKDYADAILQVILKRKAFYLNLYNAPGLRFSETTWNYDGLHPTSTGMETIGEYIKQYIIS
jgi:lysophospholipase L1-like esterase